LGVIKLVLRAELKRRWRSWIALAALIALVGGLVLAAAAAGRRTASAFPDFVSTYGFDAAVYSNQPVPELAKVPGVSSVTELITLYNGQPTCSCTHAVNPDNFDVDVVPPAARPVSRLLSGHWPDPSSLDQVLASFTLEEDYGVHVGTVIRVPFYTPSQAAAVNSAVGAGPAPKGPTVALRVVGFEAAEPEFPSGNTPLYDVYPTPAFARSIMPRTAVSYTYFVRLRGGEADVPRFYGQAKALNVAGIGASNQDALASFIESSVHPQAVGWWLLAALAAVVGLAVLGQALFRQSVVESEDYPTMRAIGADRSQLFMLGMARTLVVAFAGAVGAVVLATVLSPLAPLGEARTAEASTGFGSDTRVLLLGSLGTVVVVFALNLWPALRAARPVRFNDGVPLSRPSVIVALFAGMRVPVSALIGVRHALERKISDATVPVGNALLGSVLAVMALCGTGVFGASLSHLTATPRLYGDPFQLSFPSNAGWSPALITELEHDSYVTGITEGVAGEISVDRVTVGAVVGTAVRGRLLFATVSGHLPSGAGQVGLGATTMRQLGAHVGSVLAATIGRGRGEQRTVPLRVVSQVSFPVFAGAGEGLGSGLLFSRAGFEAAACAPGPTHALCFRKEAEELGNGGGGLLVGVAPGPLGRADINRYLATHQAGAALPEPPTSLINFGQAVNFPLIFGAILALFGGATLAHLLVVSVSRRRREIALLKILGFVDGQVASVVAWQATTLAIIGSVVGTPLGVVIGRVVWRVFANNLGAVPVPVVPIWLLVVLVASVVVVANLIAVIPALVATRSKSVELLRGQ
jgi:hypothetical protein